MYIGHQSEPRRKPRSNLRSQPCPVRQAPTWKVGSRDSSMPYPEHGYRAPVANDTQQRSLAEWDASPLPSTARSQIVADHRGTQPVQVGDHDPSLDTARDLIDEPRQARIGAEPEDRHLSPQLCDVVEPLDRVGDGARVRRVVEEHRRAFTVDVFEM